MTDYTPTTEQVEDGFTYAPEHESEAEARAMFNRWLAEHDRQVKAEAWKEGYVAGFLQAMGGTAGPSLPGLSTKENEMSEYVPTTEEVRSGLLSRVMDTLAYYQCRETNPKADHPIMGYHAFSEDQREWLRENKREAAEEIVRIMAEHDAEVAAMAWDEGRNAEPVHDGDHEMYCSEYECFCDTYVNPYREETE